MDEQGSTNSENNKPTRQSHSGENQEAKGYTRSPYDELEDNMRYLKQRWSLRRSTTRSDIIQLSIFGVLFVGAIVALLNLKSLTESVEHARVAAEAANQQVDVARQATQAIIGPPIGVRDMVVDATEPLKLTLVFRNNGPTSALNYRQTGRFSIREKDWRFTPEYPGTPFAGGGELPPGAESVMPLTGADPLGPTLLGDLANGERIVYVYGYLTYADMFGQCHRTTFCRRLLADLATFAGCLNTDYNTTREQPCECGHGRECQ